MEAAARTLRIEARTRDQKRRRPAMESNRHLKLMARGIFIGIVAVLVLGPLGFNSMAWAQNAVPLISQPLVPGAAAPGGTGFNANGERHGLPHKLSRSLERRRTEHALCRPG